MQPENNKMETFNFEGLYLLQTRECIKEFNNIYKIGRSSLLRKRFEDYPCDSMVYLVIKCDDSINHERQLLAMFNYKYNNHP